MADNLGLYRNDEEQAREVKVFFKAPSTYYTFYTVEDSYSSIVADTMISPVLGSSTLYNPPKVSATKPTPLSSSKHVAPEKEWGNAPLHSRTANTTVPTMLATGSAQRVWSYNPTAFSVSYGAAEAFNWGGKAHSILTTRIPNDYPVSWGARPTLYTSSALPASAARAGANIDAVVPKLPTPRWWRRAGVQQVTSSEFGARSFHVLTDALGRFYVYPVGLPKSEVIEGVTTGDEYYAPDALVREWDFPFASYSLEAPTSDNSYPLTSKLYKSSLFKDNDRPVFVWGHEAADEDKAKSIPTTYDDWAGFTGGFSYAKPLNSAHYVWSFNYNSTRATTVAYKLQTTQTTMQGILGDDYPMYRFKDCPYGYAVPDFMATKINAYEASAMAGEGINFEKTNRTLIPCKDSVTALLEVEIRITLTGEELDDFSVDFTVLRADLSDDTKGYYVASGYSRPKWSDDWRRILNGNGLAWSVLKLTGDTDDLSGYSLTDTVFPNNTEKTPDFKWRAGTTTVKSDFYTYIRSFFSEKKQDLDELYTKLITVVPSCEIKVSTVSGDFWTSKPANVSSGRSAFKTTDWGPMLKIPVDTMITEYEIYAGDRLVDPGEVTFVSIHSLAWHLVNDPAITKFISAQIAVNLSRDDYLADNHDPLELAYYFGKYYYSGVVIDGYVLHIPTVTNPDTSVVFENYPEILYAFQGYALEALYYLNASKATELQAAFDGPLSHFYWHNYDVLFRLLQLCLIKKAMEYSELEDVIRDRFLKIYFQFMCKGSKDPLDLLLEFPIVGEPPPPDGTDYVAVYFDNLYENWSISTIDGYLASNVDTLRVRLPLNASASNTIDPMVLPADRTKRFMATLVTFPSIDAELVYAQTQAMESFGRKVYDFKAFLCGYETSTEYDEDGYPTGNFPVTNIYNYKLVETDYVASRISLDILGNFPKIEQEDVASYGKPLNLKPDTTGASIDMDCAEFLKTDDFNYPTMGFKNLQAGGSIKPPCEKYWCVTTGLDFHINVTESTTTNVVAAHDFANSDTLVYACRANENFNTFTLGSAQMRTTEMIEGTGGAIKSNIVVTTPSGTGMPINDYTLLYNWVHANFFNSDFYIPKTWLHFSPYASDSGANAETALKASNIPTNEYFNRGYSMGPEAPKAYYSFVASDAYGSSAGYLLPPKGTLQVIAAAIPTTSKRKAALTANYKSALTLDFVSLRSRKSNSDRYYKTTHNDLFNNAFSSALSEPRKYLYYCDSTSPGVLGGFATAGGFYGFKLPLELSEDCPNLKEEW